MSSAGEAKGPGSSAPLSKDALIALALKHLEAQTAIDSTWDLASAHQIDHDALVGALKSLSVEGYVVLEKQSCDFYSVTEEGQDCIDNGSPELRMLRLIAPGSSATQESLQGTMGKSFRAAQSNCMKKRWLKFDKQTKSFERLVSDEPADELAQQLQQVIATGGDVSTFDKKAWKQLQRRNMVAKTTRKWFRAVRGDNYKSEFVKPVADVTKEMLANGSWKTANFKPYNFNTLGAHVGGGNLHPLMKVRTEFRKILLELGFEEMPTNRFVESSFWNFDALFQPQQHPARDAHDTFFLTQPAQCNRIPGEYMDIVKSTHEQGGGFGSLGYRCEWKEEEARKNVLRTHTTAISSQMLERLGREYKATGVFTPKKYFSIDRVFRNETMDATHLAEFHQVEGLVADRGLGIGDLKGIIHEFFLKIGISQLRFKPAFNPYTEPSMEIFGFQPDLGKWIEIGNSGLFRPEMLQPMGLPEDVRVIAWGLSLERPTMIKYRINNIRNLFGHKCRIRDTRKAPICRFDDKSGSRDDTRVEDVDSKE